jgi:hypothetical protein
MAPAVNRLELPGGVNQCDAEHFSKSGVAKGRITVAVSVADVFDLHSQT